jgi:hypothetical protein
MTDEPKSWKTMNDTEKMDYLLASMGKLEQQLESLTNLAKHHVHGPSGDVALPLYRIDE